MWSDPALGADRGPTLFCQPPGRSRPSFMRDVLVSLRCPIFKPGLSYFDICFFWATALGLRCCPDFGKVCPNLEDRLSWCAEKQAILFSAIKLVTDALEMALCRIARFRHSLHYGHPDDGRPGVIHDPTPADSSEGIVRQLLREIRFSPDLLGGSDCTCPISISMRDRNG